MVHKVALLLFALLSIAIAQQAGAQDQAGQQAQQAAQQVQQAAQQLSQAAQQVQQVGQQQQSVQQAQQQVQQAQTAAQLATQQAQQAQRAAQQAQNAAQQARQTAQQARQTVQRANNVANVNVGVAARPGITRPNVLPTRRTLDPATRARNLRQSLTDGVRNVQSLRGNLEFVLQSLDTLQNTRDVAQLFNLFENIGASFEDQSTLLRSLQRNLLAARTAVRQAQRQATSAIIEATAVPRTSLFSAISEAFGRLTLEQQNNALRFQVALRFGNMDELRTRLASAIARTATTYTTFRPQTVNRPFGNTRPGFGFGGPNRPAFPGARPNVPGNVATLPVRPLNNGKGNGNANGNANGNRPNRPNGAVNVPNRPIFPNRGKGNGNNNNNNGNNRPNNNANNGVAANPIIVVVPQNNAVQQPQNVAANNGAAVQQPQNVVANNGAAVQQNVVANNAAVQQPQNVAAGAGAVVAARDPFAALANAEGEDADAFIAQEEEFVTDAAITDVAEEDLFVAAEDEGFVDAAFADEFTDSTFVDEFAVDAAVADAVDDEFAFAVGDEFVDYAEAADASTAPTQSSSSAAIPSWGVALIVVGVLVLLGVVLVFVQLIRLLRA